MGKKGDSGVDTNRRGAEGPCVVLVIVVLTQ